jgi:alpha-tubulin suppressor-like RCC1 family protein/uncharacterized protein YjdB
MAGVVRSAHLFAALLLLAGCDESTKPIPVASITLDPTSAALTVGSSLQLQATVRDADNNVLPDRAITWASLNTSMATVSNSGLVTAQSPGQVAITATSEGRTATTLITAQPAVSYVIVSAPKNTLGVSELLQLSVRLEDTHHAQLTGRTVTWASSSGAATVSSSGLVNGMALGNVQITATSEGRSGTILLTVTGPVMTVAVTPRSSTVPIGGTVQLNAVPMDANGTPISGSVASWVSSSDLVARVSAQGVVTSVGAGQATITATVDGKSGSGVVTVPAPVVLATVVVGSSHSCALDVDSRAYCWGNNSSSQLGDGSADERPMPTAVAGGGTYSRITGGTSHSCALDMGGLAYCWGAGSEGQLGTGAYLLRTTPTRVSSSLAFAEIAAGASYTCARLASGAAYCWGANYAGQLGDGTTASRSIPVAVTGSVSFASIGAGGQHSCGLTAAGVAYCWGANETGQLGDATTTSRSAPTAVAGGPFASLSVGLSHTCAVTAAGTAYCWGANEHGQLGDGSTASRSAPVAVAGGRTFAAISAGAVHTCGLTTTGSAFCWGANETGELGNGTSTSYAIPVAVVGGFTFGTISATSGTFSDYYYYYYYNYGPPTAHTCAVTTARVAYCWGDNSTGQLGNPSAGTSSSRPVKVTGQ